MIKHFDKTTPHDDLFREYVNSLIVLLFFITKINIK